MAAIARRRGRVRASRPASPGANDERRVRGRNRSDSHRTRRARDRWPASSTRPPRRRVHRADGRARAACFVDDGRDGFGSASATDRRDVAGASGRGDRRRAPTACTCAATLDVAKLGIAALAAARRRVVRDPPRERLHARDRSASAASSASRHTSERISLRQSSRCRLSSSPWMRLPGSAGPSRSAGMPPNASANGPTNGIEPPTPMNTGSAPKPARSARVVAVERGTGRRRSPTRARLRERRKRSSRPHGTCASMCARSCRDHAVGILTRREPQAEPRRRAGDDLVRRALDRVTVDPDDGERRPEPQARVQRERRDRRRSRRRAAARARARSARARRRSPGSVRISASVSGRDVVVRCPSTASVAVLVDQRREHPRRAPSPDREPRRRPCPSAPDRRARAARCRPRRGRAASR